MQLLLLEDEPAIRTALTRALTRWGHQVRPASDLASARQVIADTRVEGLLSDLKLPDGSGLEMARELAVPFVLMSGYAAFDDAVEALRLGCVDFLTKPVAMATLRRALETLTARAGASPWEFLEPGEPWQQTSLVASGTRSAPLSAQVWTWSDREQGRERFLAEVDEGAARVAERQLLAELVQAAPAGRLVINHSSRWWRAWLSATCDWEGDAALADRRLVIEDLADRSLFRPDAVAVEVVREG